MKKRKVELNLINKAKSAYTQKENDIHVQEAHICRMRTERKATNQNKVSKL